MDEGVEELHEASLVRQRVLVVRSSIRYEPGLEYPLPGMPGRGEIIRRRREPVCQHNSHMFLRRL